MKKIFCVISTAALTSILSLPTHAMLHAPGKAYHPIHYKPNVSYLQPTGLSPSQVQTAYGIKNIASQGEGQIIAIVDAYDHPSIEKDLGVFDNAFGLPACTSANGCFTKVYAEGYPPQTDAGWAGEIALDVEWAHAIAPKAKIILVEANDSSLDALFHAVQIATQNGANVVSMSWGGSEFSSETSFDKYFNVPNVTFVASSGDNGTGASYPAASPYVVGAGGTTLSLDNNGNYAGETAWSGSGGGISAYETIPNYQNDFQIPNNPNNMRGIPDIAYNADPETGYSVYCSISNKIRSAGWSVVGGTSASAPQWAAFAAIANSSLGSNMKNLNDLLYHAASLNYASDYNDITSGSNGNCGDNCTAQTGYDYVTGIGSLQANNLINDLASFKKYNTKIKL